MQNKNCAEIIDLEKQRSVLRLDRMAMRKKLKRSEEHIVRAFKISSNEIIQMIEEDKDINLEITDYIAKKTVTSITDAVIRLIEIKSELATVEASLNSFVETKYNSAIIRDIIGLYFKLWTDKLLSGSVLHMPSIGNCKVIKANAVEIVDWQTSLAIKDKIIEEKGLPFKAIRDLEGKVIGNNGGQHWLSKRFVDGLWLRFAYSVTTSTGSKYKLKTCPEFMSRLADIKNNHKELLVNYPFIKLRTHA